MQAGKNGKQVFSHPELRTSNSIVLKLVTTALYMSGLYELSHFFFSKIGIYSMQGMELQEKEEGKYKSKRE